MNHIVKQKLLDDYESCGPRPPVQGQESRLSKMTEGRSSSNSSIGVAAAASVECNRTSPPAYFKWHQTLSGLLEDREGVEIFKRYVEAEGGIHSDRLNFYFACEGLKQQFEEEKVKSMVGAIYR